MMTHQPTVSVLVLTYNHATFIGQCLDSIIQQRTDFKFEIILGEDGSTDGTREICIEYANRYPDIIRLGLRDQNKKVFLYGRATGKYNLLKTLQEGHGKYFAFCDGDDYWSDLDKLQKQVDFMETHPAYSLCSTNRLVLKDGVFSKDETLAVAFEKNAHQPLEVSKTNSFRNYVKTNVALFRKVALNYDILERHYTEVNDTFIFYMLAHEGKGIVMPWVSAVYRLHSGGRWSATSRFHQIKIAHHTMRGLYNSALGNDKHLKVKYRKSLSLYCMSAISNKEWKEVIIAFREHPFFCLTAVPIQLIKILARPLLPSRFKPT